MKKPLALLVVAFLFSPLTALAGPDNYPAWQHVANRLLDKANYHPDMGIFILSNVSAHGNLESHQADYLACYGRAVNPDGVVVPYDTGVTSESWKMQDDGTWLIEQWVFHGSAYGKPTSVIHRLIHETTDHIVLDVNYDQETNPLAPAVLDQWWSILNRWYDWDNAHPR